MTNLLSSFKIILDYKVSIILRRTTNNLKKLFKCKSMYFQLGFSIVYFQNENFVFLYFRQITTGNTLAIIYIYYPEIQTIYYLGWGNNYFYFSINNFEYFNNINNNWVKIPKHMFL